MVDILQLIEQPFGPYPHSDILNDGWNPNAAKLPELEDLFFWLNDKVVGLDSTEWINPPPTGHPIASSVQWFGVLHIKSLNWLSDQGHEWLQADLRKRDVESQAFRRAPSSHLTLKSLYGNTKDEGSQLKVYLQGEKVFPVAYLTSADFPRGMLLFARQYVGAHGASIDRRYVVKSLDVEIIDDSRHFLARYQLLANMKDIISNDPYPPPPEDRDLDYWVDNYLLRRRTNEYYHRYIFDPEDGATDEDGFTTQRRHLRHIPRADVAAIYASQAEWLLALQASIGMESQRIVNLRKWKEVCLQIRRERRDAIRHGVTWGIPQHRDDDMPLEKYLQVYFFAPEAHIKRINKVRVPAKTKSQALSPPSPTVSDQEQAARRPLVINHIYDSDFSVESSSAASDSEDGIASDVLAAIPTFCWEPPRLIDGSFEWECPGKDCQYKLDLLNITAPQASVLSPPLSRFLRSRQWCSRADPRFQAGFETMVSAHYKSHIKEKDIYIRFENNKVCGGWYHPSRHTTMATPKKAPPRPLIKTEDVGLSLSSYSRTSLPEPQSRTRSTRSRSHNSSRSQASLSTTSRLPRQFIC